MNIQSILIHNVSEGTVTIQAQTDEQIAELEKFSAEMSQIEADRQSKIASRESALAKLKALGLTEEEVSAITQIRN
jgi:DNA-binding NarL/FixJ family response regulator